MTGMGFGGTTSEPVISHLDDSSQPLQISFHYHRLKEKDWGDNRITATFEETNLPVFTAERPPVIAIQLGVPRTQTSTLEIQLPPGWNAQLPDPVHAHTPFATCDVTYRFDKGKLFAERRLVILKKQIPLADFKQYQTWYDEAGASGVPFIQLVPPPKPTTPAALPVPRPAPPPPPPGVPDAPSDPHAAELIQKAGASARAMDLDASRKYLDAARAINENEPQLWLGYATIAELLGQSNELIDDIQHELSLHPHETMLYAPLAKTQIKHNDPEAALATLRTWVKIAPTDRDAALGLCRALQASKRYAEALSEAQSALTRLGPDAGDLTRLHLIVAEAQVDLNHPQQAAAEALPLLKTSTDPSLLNGAAYVLARAGSHLDEAYTAQTGVLTSVEAETASWSTGEDGRRLLEKQSNLAADWDTMGWILYRQGRLPEAFAYLGAALRTLDASTIRDHYIAVASALHTPSAIADAHRSDQQLRTFPLRGAAGGHGVSGFTILLARGELLEASRLDRDASSTPPLPGAESLLKTTDFRTLFPPGSKARLVRKGFVNCHSGICELILYPLNAQ